MKSYPAGVTLEEDSSLPIFGEMWWGLESLGLLLSPVNLGLGIPRGDGRPIVPVPGFLGTDLYLRPLSQWLSRIGYRVFDSKVGRNARCFNSLVESLTARAESVFRKTGEPVTLIGHSLGGTLALVVGHKHPDKIRQVILLGSPITPIEGQLRVHPQVLRVAESIRNNDIFGLLRRPVQNCFTTDCLCSSVRIMVEGKHEAPNPYALYSKSDGVVDWRCCLLSEETRNIQVRTTHMGLVFSSSSFYSLSLILAGQARYPSNFRIDPSINIPHNL